MKKHNSKLIKTAFTNNDKKKKKNTTEPNWEKQLKSLITWSQEKKGYDVLFKDIKRDSVDFDKKEIVIAINHTSEIALYCLLHELGHILLVENKRKYNSSYDFIWNNFSKNSLTYRITTLQEELDAWCEGLKLAKSLKMKIKKRKYEILKAKCIATYLPWVVRRSAVSYCAQQ